MKVLLQKVNDALNSFLSPADNMAEEDVYEFQEVATDDEAIINSLMESWNQLYAHVNGRAPSLNDINSQFLVSKFALETAKHLDPALFIVTSNVCESEGYASPPPWAIRVARGALIEYLTGTLPLIRTCMSDHHGVENSE